MKKRGLIVATIVMVLVLAVSITTATYAWFSASASAAVTNFTLSAASATGLSIGYATPGAIQNGTLGLNADSHTWVDDGPAGFGTNIAFTSTDMVSMYGCTGDGVTLRTAADSSNNINSSTAVAGGKPVKMADARPNQDFFTADIAVQLNDDPGAGHSANIYLNSFHIVAENQLIAASARIAFFQIDPNGDEEGATAGTGTTEALTATATATPLFILIPYTNVVDSAGTATLGTAETSWEFNTTASGSAYSASTKDTLTGSGDTWYQKNIVWNAATALGALTFVDDAGTKRNTGTGSSGTYSGAYGGATAATNVATPTFGTISNRADNIYLRVVVWFEGEDKQCSQSAAGGNISLDFAFGYVVV